MAPSTPKDEPLEPAPISAGGTYTLQTVSVGCKIFIRRPNADGETEERLAEILSIREKPATRQSSRHKTEQSTSALDDPADQWEYFVHWEHFNKRLDEWVAGSRLILSRDLEWPRPKAPLAPKKAPPQKVPKVPKAPGKAPRVQSASLLKRATSNAAAWAGVPGTPASTHPDTPMFSGPPSPSPIPSTPLSLKRKLHSDVEGFDLGEEPDDDADGDADDDADGDMDIDAEGDQDADGEGEGEGETFELTLTGAPVEPPPPVSSFSKEQEIEKLRTSGSMTQSVSEVARVKNLNRLQIGKYEVEAWYFSPYPQEYAHLPVLYICEMCLAYYPSEFMLMRHRKRCNALHPPGNEIYRHEDISFYELDGKRQLTYCRNLSLISKCFLDHKTLYYDVTPFLYYVMCQRDSRGSHIIGYFSKEKESAENYNVACILCLPQYQRLGLGKLLIEFSYELSKKENKLGSPEKPLSDLGLLGYRSYWAETIVEVLAQNIGREMSVEEIAHKTSITQTDIQNTCVTLQLFKHHKGQYAIVLNDAVLERHKRAREKKRRRIDPDKLVWKPPVFSRDQLRFGF